MINNYHFLTHLNLGYNRICKDGANHLGEGIKAIKDCFSVFSISSIFYFI